MSFIHDDYNTILQNNVDEISYNLLNGQVPLANSVLRVLAQAFSKVQYLQYDFLDYVSLQCCPSTATDEYLDNWAALKGVTRKAASQATGVISFTGTSGASIPAGTVLVAEDGETYTTDNLVDVGSNVGITAVNSGSEGNQAANITMSLQVAIAGVDSTLVLSNAITTGSDIESDSELRVRTISAFSTVSTGDSRQDHLNWALAVPGVTQAWVPPSPIAGTECVIYVMLDRTNSTLGYPQGTNGTASSETRYVVATGDQLTVANAMYAEKPYTEIQIICSPIQTNIDFTISGLSTASASIQAAVKAAVVSLLHDQGTPLGTSITLAAINSAISSAAGSTSYTLTAPTADISLTTGELPEVGTMTFS